MVMLGLHYVDKFSQIYFTSQYSYLDLMLLIKDSLFQTFQHFQEDYFKLHDPITEWLEQCYLASSIANNKFRPFLILAKQDDHDTKEGPFVRSF